MTLKEIIKLVPWKNFIEIKVVPNSAKTEYISIMDNNVLKIAAKWVPEKWKVNDEIIKYIAKELWVSKNNITIISWGTSRNKLVRIDF